MLRKSPGGSVPGSNQSPLCARSGNGGLGCRIGIDAGVGAFLPGPHFPHIRILMVRTSLPFPSLSKHHVRPWPVLISLFATSTLSPALLCFSPSLSSFTCYTFCSSTCLLSSSLISCLFCSQPRCWAHTRHSRNICGMKTAYNSSYILSIYNAPDSAFTLYIHSLIYPHNQLTPILQMCKLRLRDVK